MNESIDSKRSNRSNKEIEEAWHTNVLRGLFCGLLVGGIILIIMYRSAISDEAEIFTDWVQIHPLYSFLAIAAGILFCCVAMIPLGPWAIGAGYAYQKVYPVAWQACSMGIGAVFAGMYFGAIIAFLLGRFMLRKSCATCAHKYRFFRAIDSAISDKEGLKFAFMIRLCPISPFAAVSYLLGMSKLSVRDVMLANFGSLPMLSFYVYFGYNLSSI